MIPLNQFTPTPVIAAFVPPYNDAYIALTMRAPGGVSIGDGSQGRETQFWTCSYDGTSINVVPASTGSPFALAVANVLSCSVAFDANMAVCLSYTKADGAYLYFFNGVHSQYETIFIAGASSCRNAVDKTTPFYSGQSDIIFAYLDSTSALRYRVQRDRYAIEYTIASTPGTLIRLGPSVQNRLQLELQVTHA